MAFLFAVVAATGACPGPSTGEGPPSSDGGPDAPAAEVATGVGGVDAADSRDPGDGDDARGAGDAADAASRVTCASVRALATRGALTARRARQVLFTRELDGIVLRVAGEAPVEGGFIPDDVLYVRLSDGAVTTLVRAASAVEWLGATSDLLVTSALTGALSVVTPSTGDARVLGGTGCDHVTAPDGSRVFVTVGCDLTRTPRPVDELDVRSGVATRIAQAVGYRSLVVSPGGAQAAYVAIPATGDAGTGAAAGIVHVVDRAHRDTALTAVVSASELGFVSDDLLLFQQGGGNGVAPDIYRFRPGDAAPALVARERHPGFRGYRISGRSATLLAARFLGPLTSPDELYGVRLDGSGETLLAKDLARYQQNATRPSAFAFSPDGLRALYVDDGWTATSSVPASGGTALRLGAGGSFAVSPFAERVALIEQDPTSGHFTLRVVGTASDREAFRYESDHIFGALTFVAGDRGLLFVEHPDSLTVVLQYLSFASGSVASLGRWTQSALTPVPFLDVGETGAGYPVDPTGCFTVVDSDAPGATGVRVAVFPE